MQTDHYAATKKWNSPWSNSWSLPSPYLPNKERTKSRENEASAGKSPTVFKWIKLQAKNSARKNVQVSLGASSSDEGPASSVASTVSVGFPVKATTMAWS